MEESFGGTLRRERELRFIELEEISRGTMISTRFLEAIEHNDFDSLPHSTFVRGFLRAYAKYVGLNQDEVITNYEHYLQSIQVEGVPEEPEEKTNAVNYASLRIWIGVLIALLVGGLILYLALYQGEDASPPEQEKVSTVTPHPAQAPEAKSVPLISEEEEPLAKSDEPTTIKPTISPKDAPVTAQGEALPASIKSPPPPILVKEKPARSDSAPEGVLGKKGVELTLQAIEESWVLFQLDDEPETDVIMYSGTSKILNAQAKIVLTIGNAAGMELTLNGKPLPPLGKEGQVVRGLVFEAEAETEEQAIQNTGNRIQNSE